MSKREIFERKSSGLEERIFPLMTSGPLVLILIVSNLTHGLAQENPQKRPLRVKYYDFPLTHKDFGTNACYGQWRWGGGDPGEGTPKEGLVEKLLGSNRKPVPTPPSTRPDSDIGGSLMPNLESFRDLRVQDFFDSTVATSTHCSEITLDKDPDKTNSYRFNVVDDFFPLDSVTLAMGNVLDTYQEPNGPIKKHNYGFCAEIHSTFQYRGGEVFHFRGDDDVWVFINRKLAIDLGGTHFPVIDSIALDQAAGELGLVKNSGQYYSFDMFFCERQPGGSTISISSGIDFIPILPNGVNIKDGMGKPLSSTDTIVISDPDKAITFEGVYVPPDASQDKCDNVVEQNSQPAKATWSLKDIAGGASQRVGDSVSLVPITLGTRPEGTYWLIAEQGGTRDSVLIILKVKKKVLARALSGYYLDKDGDGRIESAVLVFDQSEKTPAAIEFRDPGDSRKTVPAGTLVSGPRGTVTATFPPFSPGTGFAPGEFAVVKAEAGYYSEQPVSMADSAGVVALAVEAFPLSDSSAGPALIVDFSEAVMGLDPAAPPSTLPFSVVRNGNEIDPNDFRITSVERLSPTRYRLELDGALRYPVPGDSLRLRPGAGVTDAHDKTASDARFIRVTGNPGKVTADVKVDLYEPVARGPLPEKALAGIPFLIQGPGYECFNCPPGLTPEQILGIDGKTAATQWPTWILKGKYPFQYHLSVFSNLGEFVNKLEGEIVKEQIDRAGAASHTGGMKITLIPISHLGRRLATGAYIMKGTFQIKAGETLRGKEGEAIIVEGGRQEKVSRFGFIRED